MKIAQVDKRYNAPPRTPGAGQMSEGFWLVRERLGNRKWGPPLPAAIMWLHTTSEPGRPDNPMDRSPFLAAFIGGEPTDLGCLHVTSETFGNHRIYRREREMDWAEYERRLADLQWAKKHAPHEPIANPRRPLDLMQAPLPF